MTDKDYQEIFDQYTGIEDDLLPLLLRVQEKDGYISEESVRRISRFLRISENQIYGVASFYSKYRFDKPGRNTIKVCMGTACHVRGGKLLADAVGWQLGIGLGQVTPDGRFDFRRVTCLGCCTLAPVVQINDDVHDRVLVTGLKETLKQYE
ncbi:NADH-quinone oxidoreductase subunit E [candidate division GN15 bacterium]|nr:NADH-quinone oxidoreductase subunit E [candidate division GN15 bacterium]